MERRLNEFLDIHAGETAWLFGKGPSLDRFNFDDAGPLRVGINELAGIVPGCKYGFSNDQVLQWIDVYSSDQVLFTPHRTAKDYDQRPVCDVCVFEDHPGTPLTRDRSQLAKGLHLREGTIGSAFQILHIMGVTKIIAVGIDGGNAHASTHKFRTELWNNHYKQYNKFKHQFIEGCTELGIGVQFFNEKGNQMADGKKTVLFTGNTFVRGIPYQADTISELSEADARDVVAAGQAVFTQAKVHKPQLETAAKSQEVEVPEKRTVAPKRAKKGTKGK